VNGGGAEGLPGSEGGDSLQHPMGNKFFRRAVLSGDQEKTFGYNFTRAAKYEAEREKAKKKRNPCSARRWFLNRRENLEKAQSGGKMLRGKGPCGVSHGR